MPFTLPVVQQLHLVSTSWWLVRPSLPPTTEQLRVLRARGAAARGLPRALHVLASGITVIRSIHSTGQQLYTVLVHVLVGFLLEYLGGRRIPVSIIGYEHAGAGLQGCVPLPGG